MAKFTVELQMNATATAVVEADDLAQAREKFNAGQYELTDITTDGVADTGNNADAASWLEPIED